MQGAGVKMQDRQMVTLFTLLAHYIWGYSMKQPATTADDAICI